MHAVIVVGNPKLGSRTRRAAELVAARLPSVRSTAVIELADLGAALVGWGNPEVADAKREVLEADLLVIAAPTFKGTYPGLLKLFLDQFGAGEISDTPTIALMLGAGPGHALTVQYTLVPVLVEIGCSCPAPPLYLLDSDFETSPVVDAWMVRAGRVLRDAHPDGW